MGLLLAAGALSGGGGHAPPSLAATAKARADQYLRAQAGALGLRGDLADLRMLEVREGLSAVHVRYQQTFQGVPVFGSGVTVSLPKVKDSRPSTLSRYRPGFRPPSSAIGIDAQGAIAMAEAAVGGGAQPVLRGQPSAELVYAADGGAYALAWQVLLPTLEPLGAWLVHLRADDGGVLLKQNVLRFDGGRVFDPNPAQTSATIPPPGECDTPAQEASVAGQYRNRDLLNIVSGQGKLVGAYVDLTAPGISGGYKPAGLADEAGRTYVYPCTDDRFEEVMVYYHLDFVQRKLQSLGFKGEAGIYQRPLPAHAHYFQDCNAFYDPISRGVHFGDSDLGGCNGLGPPPDTGEDADVIVHEYGHAIQDDQVPGWGFGDASVTFQAASMGEGFADFLPAAISGDPCLGEWASFGRNACGGGEGLRTLENSATYSAVQGTVVSLPSWCSNAADVHCSGLVWGGALWDLVQALPGGVSQANRDLVLQLVLDAHFYLDPWATFAEAAGAIEAADAALYGGSHLPQIDAVFTARGITPAALADFAYAYINIRHSFAGDLDVNIKVGSQSAPLCTINVTDRDITRTWQDVVGILALDASACGGFLPPAVAQPWWLEVRDGFTQDVGTIEDFQVVLSGTQRCLAVDTPVAVPDAPNDPGPDGQFNTADDPFGPFVYSQVDCAAVSGPPGLATDTDGDGIPDVIDDDDDNDSRGLTRPEGLIFRDAVEFFVGTSQTSACGGANAWPPNFNDNPPSTNKIDIFDIVAMAPPVFFSQDGQPDYRRRLDLTMDGRIDILDVTELAPPIFYSTCVP
ncbi:MAG: M36 family metallopeptidase [Chloroflexi bacterium]|nr:M36 family metallopeptidase [Chloroflexota bacterium]